MVTNLSLHPGIGVLCDDQYLALRGIHHFKRLGHRLRVHRQCSLGKRLPIVNAHLKNQIDLDQTQKCSWRVPALTTCKISGQQRIANERRK